MDNIYYSTKEEQRKRGQHLGAEERGTIQSMKKLGYSNRSIAKIIGCSPSTIGYELKRGTLAYSGKGRRPVYLAKRGAAVYQKHRQHCHQPRRIKRDSPFTQWMTKQLRLHKWSFDTCVGYAKLHDLFPASEIPSTKTLYNMLWANELPVNLFDLPEVLSRRQHRKPKIYKRLNGKSIDMRPEAVSLRREFGHWESDTVVGRKRKGEPAVFTIVERTTGYYLSIKIDGKTVDGVADAMGQLYLEFGEKFSQVFRSITTDNGSEFTEFSAMESLGTTVYFAHPYSAWERPVNERSNRLLRRFIPKGKSIDAYTDYAILMFADEINALPRKRLRYHTPEELFEAKLDQIYKATK